MITSRFLALLTAAGFATPLGAQAPVPVHREPRHHLVFEEGPVRVLDVQIPPGDTSLFHIHDAPILYVPVSLSPMDTQIFGSPWAGATSRMRVTASTSDTGYAARATTHRVANVGTSLFRLIAVTNAHAATAPTDSAPPGNLEQNSSWFRQTRLPLSPGESSPWYTSHLVTVVVQPLDGHTSIESPGSSRALHGAGTWAFMKPGDRFRVQNVGSTATTVVFVQPR